MSTILATVGGMPITDEDVNSFLRELGPRAQSYMSPEGRKVILNQLIGSKLLLLDAKRNLLETEPEFKAELARLKDSLLTSYAAEKAISSVKVSDKDVEDYYNQNKEQFVSGESVNASHILVDSEEKAAAVKSALRTRQRRIPPAPPRQTVVISVISARDRWCLSSMRQYLQWRLVKSPRLP